MDSVLSEVGVVVATVEEVITGHQGTAMTGISVIGAMSIQVRLGILRLGGKEGLLILAGRQMVIQDTGK